MKQFMKSDMAYVPLALALVFGLVTAAPRRGFGTELCTNSTSSIIANGAPVESSIGTTPSLAAVSSGEVTASSVALNSSGKLFNFGRCANPGIVFGAGFDGRKEGSFEPADTQQFTHGSAQKIKIITGFICDRLRDTCKASAQAQGACKFAEAATAGLTGQKAADAWNGALGLVGTTNLTDIASSSGTTGPSVPSTTLSASVLQAAPPPSRNFSSSSTNANATAAASFSADLDLGSCSNPKIEFGAGFGGRTEKSFQPADKTEFNHGSADNIGIITSFIGQQLADKCKGSQAALKVCIKASNAAKKLSGQAAADAFNTTFDRNSSSPDISGLGTAASSNVAQVTVTGSSSGPSTATATGSVEEPDARTSPSDGRKANGQRKEQSGGKQGSKDGGKGATPPGADAGPGNANNTNPVLNLLASNLQSASDATGIEAQNAEKARAASATAPNNFINFCSGKTLTNGLQVKSGSCNGIVMGDIPSTANMVSQIITFPEVGEASKLKAHQTFQIKVQVTNLDAGSFTNPDTTYYAAPQRVKNGKIVGHTHVTVQDLGRSLTPKKPLDPKKFTFFKGINDGGDGKGGLSATVTGGLPAGNYRVCTLGSSSNHQPVLMPVAQRGAQDDCQKFVVQ